MENIWCPSAPQERMAEITPIGKAEEHIRDAGKNADSIYHYTTTQTLHSTISFKVFIFYLTHKLTAPNIYLAKY